MPDREPPTIEHRRVAEDVARIVRWRAWGPFVSERAWGTVREDYSATGDAARKAGPRDREVEIADLGIFDDDRFFDVVVEYAKTGPSDVFMIITAHNRASEDAPLHLLPTLWFRNTWAWGEGSHPEIRALDIEKPDHVGARAVERTIGDYFLYVDGEAELLFTENET